MLISTANIQAQLPVINKNFGGDSGNESGKCDYDKSFPVMFEKRDLILYFFKTTSRKQSNDCLIQSLLGVPSNFAQILTLLENYLELIEKS